MSNLLNVATIQLNISWTDIEQNLLAARDAIAALPPDTDVALLPEMFTTGFVTDPRLASRLAGGMESRVTGMMREWAHEFNLAVAGSVIVRHDADGTLRNRMIFAEPSGETTIYDKRHLFTPSGENGTYAPGTRHIPVVRFRGWNLALAVCYDLRFPVWLRNTPRLDTDPEGPHLYDALLIVANWPDTRAYAWTHLLIARAIENQCYVAGANRTGIDDYGVYSGHSEIFDPKGLPISSPLEGSPQPTCVATLDMEALLRFRGKFPVGRDADRYTIYL